VLPLLEFKSLTQLGNRHLFHQAVTASLGRIKALGSLNRDFFKFSNLSNQFHSLCQLSSLFISSLLESFLQLAMYFISYCFIGLFFENNLLCRSVLVRMYLRNHIFLIDHDLRQILISLFHHFIHVIAHLVNKLVILFFFPFTR